MPGATQHFSHASLWGTLRRRVFGISASATSFERRGFRGGTLGLRQRLECVVMAFVHGYHAALEAASSEALEPQLDGIAPEFRGFAFEGAAMGLALLDWLTPWRRDRLATFLRGAGAPHAYMVHVGAGWVLARVPANLERVMAKFDPLLGWLLMDGYGFHEAFFHFRRHLPQHTVPKRVQGYARRVFDQGFGRCLWFVEGAEVDRIRATIGGFPAARHGDLWSGVGLASVYAGEISESSLRALRLAADPYLPQLAQGAAFAAKARIRAGNPTPYTDVACRILCGMSAADAAQVTDLALENLPAHGDEPAYEVWRRRIQHKYSLQTENNRL